MGTRIATRKHVLDQIPREIDVLEKLVRSLPGKDKAAKNEQSQINQFGQALTCAHYIVYAAIALSQRAIELSPLYTTQHWRQQCRDAGGGAAVGADSSCPSPQRS